MILLVNYFGFRLSRIKGYIADIPDLKFCSAFGKTPEEALKEVLIAKDAWLEAAYEENKPVLPPRYKPAIYHATS